MQHVLIADDHEVTRRGVKDLLREASETVQFGEAANMREVLALLPQRQWDLILLDVMMPGGNVIDVLKQIRAVDSRVPILVLTAATELEYVVETMKVGANGVVHKHRAVDDLMDAINQVANGGSYLHPETAVAIASSLKPPTDTPIHEKLSEREAEIFRLIALGRTVKEIAADLGLSEKTVATYLGRIREKTGLQSHVDIARYALQHGLVD